MQHTSMLSQAYPLWQASKVPCCLFIVCFCTAVMELAVQYTIRPFAFFQRIALELDFLQPGPVRFIAFRYADYLVADKPADTCQFLAINRGLERHFSLIVQQKSFSFFRVVGFVAGKESPPEGIAGAHAHMLTEAARSVHDY